MQTVAVGDFIVGLRQPLTVVSGPCVIEGEEHALRCAEFLSDLFRKKRVNFIFKSSYDKANRTAVSSFRGPGLKEGLRILEKVKNQFNIPVFTDVHQPEDIREAAQVCDVIQIPAFLCRQTDLLVAAGASGAVINIKKGQFMAPWDMKHAVEKILSTGNNQILLTDRGTSFGYNNLVSDMRAIPIMQKLGFPVLFDATHAVQLPAKEGHCSGGEREFVEVLARASLAAGCQGIYAEAHPDPAQAKSDAACQIPFTKLPQLIDEWLLIYEAMQKCIELHPSS